ncbi:MAG: lysophospholipid acyltransferase family protein [Bacillota bacterium]|nr:lysophospholipid acyltransferase family protein [Bacillota bacterium]
MSAKNGPQPEINMDRKTAVTRQRRPAAETPVRPVHRGISGCLLNSFGMWLTRHLVRLEGRGLENLPASAPYILAPNHETFVDGMWVASFLPREQFKLFCSLAGSDLLTDYGLFGRIIMRVGRGVPIDRHGSPLSGLQLARAQLEAGEILMIHPEGTRSHDGRLGRIQEGAAFIAKRCRVPIIPVFIDGGYEIFGRHSTWPTPRDENGEKRRLILTFGKPLDPADFRSARDMTAALAAWMNEKFAQKEVPRLYASEKQAGSP